MKPSRAPEMIFKGHSRSLAVSSFIRSPGLSVRDQKSRLHLFSSIIAEMTLNSIARQQYVGT